MNHTTKTILKWTGISFGALIVLLIVIAILVPDEKKNAIPEVQHINIKKPSPPHIFLSAADFENKFNNAAVKLKISKRALNPSWSLGDDTISVVSYTMDDHSIFTLFLNREDSSVSQLNYMDNIEEPENFMDMYLMLDVVFSATDTSLLPTDKNALFRSLGLIPNKKGKLLDGQPHHTYKNGITYDLAIQSPNSFFSCYPSNTTNKIKS